MPAGRPSVYKPEFCDIIIELGKQGKSNVQMACALDISKDTLYEWAKSNPVFSDSLARARGFAQDWWETVGQNSLHTKEFQPSLWAKVVGCRFRDDYQEKQAIEHSGEVKTTAPVLNIFTNGKAQIQSNDGK